MTTCAPAIYDPEKIWLRQAFAALEDSFGRPLQLWIYHQDGTWQTDGTCGVHPADPTTIHHDDYVELLETARNQAEPCTNELSGGHHLLAIPLGEMAGHLCSVATVDIETTSPELLLNTAKMGQHFFKQQKNMSQMRDENNFFLKQVSNDFEELSFLRTMAQTLGLGEHTQVLSEIMTKSLPTLGESVGSKFLYFISHHEESSPQVTSKWIAEGYNRYSVEESVLERLVEHYRQAALQQPVIKNGFLFTEEGKQFVGVNDFVLVSVSTRMNEVGWFLAVNRHYTDERTSDPVMWRLSQHEFGTSEASLLSTAAAMFASHANNLSLFQEREELLVNVVRSLVSAVEAKDQYTCGHSERVALYAKRLAQQVGYDEKECELLYLTGLLHDVGKIAVSDAVLNKPGLLTDEEFAEIMSHPDEGWTILQGLEQLSYVLPGVLHHHERTDGKGYPDGLSGDSIPRDGRVLAVADAYDAMTSNRAYRKGMSHEKAVEILREGAGTQWDPVVVDAFFEVINEIVAIRKCYQPRQQPQRKPTPSVANDKFQNTL